MLNIGGRVKLNIWNFVYFIVSITLFSRFFDFLSSGNPSYLVVGSTGILMILLIFSKSKHFIKLYMLTLIGLILLSVLIITYTYLFKPIYASSYAFYYAIGAILLYIICLALVYLREYPKLSEERLKD